MQTYRSIGAYIYRYIVIYRSTVLYIYWCIDMCVYRSRYRYRYIDIDLEYRI